MCIRDSAQSDSAIKGRIIEKLTDTPLEYVNIGVVGKGVGTVSNVKGEFFLNIPSSYDNDILKVSMVGYKSQEFVVSNFKSKIANDYNIFLEPKTEVIEEIAIVDSNLKSYTKGNNTTSKNFTVGFESDLLGNEIATKFKIRKRHTLLKELSISIGKNTYDTLSFRVNIYSVKNGKPGEILNKKNIIVTTTKKDSEVLLIDLLPYHITLQENFFVSLEWIKDLEGGDLSFSAAFPGRTLYYKKTSHDNFQGVKGLGMGMQITYLQ